MAAFGALMNPPPYIAIALLFFLMGLILLPAVDGLLRKYLNLIIPGGIKVVVIIICFMVICLIVPQVKTNSSNSYLELLYFFDDT
ncbi:MAG: hypothetical protein AAFQ80_02045 [Cyanobacteria bacterium J06621_8]